MPAEDQPAPAKTLSVEGLGMHEVPPAGFETLLGVGSGPPSRQPCGHQTKSACMDALCLRVEGGLPTMGSTPALQTTRGNMPDPV